MHQSDLNRAVSRATGETVTTIKRLGFLIADPDLNLDPHDEDLGPYVIDWDELEVTHEREEVPVPACA